MELCLKVREPERLRESGIGSCRVSHADRLGNSAGCGGGELGCSAVAPCAASAGDEFLDHDNTDEGIEGVRQVVLSCRADDGAGFSSCGTLC